MKNNINPLYVLGHKVTLIDTLGDFDMASIITHPNIPGPLPHYHENESELFYIVSGQMEIMHGDEWFSLTAGESAVIPKGVVHTFINKGTEDVNWMTCWSPKGFGEFFKDFGVPASIEDAFQKSVSTEIIERVGREVAKYGMIIQVPVE
jgi:mannose-6-phosphate isomerase-like protein (cupin superfamily)